MSPEVAQGELLAEQVARGLRKKYLAAVSRAGDPRCSMDIHPHISGLGRLRLARVKPHPDADRTRRERLLRLLRRGDRLSRARKGNEKGVALCIDLDTAVCLDSVSNRPSVLV